MYKILMIKQRLEHINNYNKILIKELFEKIGILGHYIKQPEDLLNFSIFIFEYDIEKSYNEVKHLFEDLKTKHLIKMNSKLCTN